MVAGDRQHPARRADHRTRDLAQVVAVLGGRRRAERIADPALRGDRAGIAAGHPDVVGIGQGLVLVPIIANWPKKFGFVRVVTEL